MHGFSMNSTGKIPTLLPLVTLVFLAASCKTRTNNETGLLADRTASPVRASLIPAGPGLGEAGERPEPDEAASITGMVDHTLGMQKIIRAREGKEGDPLKRGVHTKAIGCARGVFEIDPHLPQDFVNGVFQAGVRYPVQIRLSNGTPGTGSDRLPSSRGFAIKLLDVEGRLAAAGKSLPPEEGAWLIEERKSFGQDFTFLSHRQFISKDLKTYIEFSEGLATGKPLSGFVNLDPRHPRFKPVQAKTLLETVLEPVSNPVEVSYFGQLPYKFKTTAAKWRLDRCEKQPKQDRLGKDSPADALFRAMASTLSQGDVCYDFSITLQKDPKVQPIEDSNIEWLSDEGDVKSGRKFANVKRIARLIIPKQSVADPATDAKCEAMSFNAWHSLAAHKPLGSMSRARKAIYLGGMAARPAAPVGETPDAEHEAMLARPSAFDNAAAPAQH